MCQRGASHDCKRPLLALRVGNPAEEQRKVDPSECYVNKEKEQDGDNQVRPEGQGTISGTVGFGKELGWVGVVASPGAGADPFE